MGFTGLGQPRADHALLLARIGSQLTLAVGLTVVAGWLWNLPRLTYVFVPVGPNVKTNAGVALACAGLANLCLLWRGGQSRLGRTLGWALAAVCLCIGGATLSEHLVGWELGIDEWLATEAPGAMATASPNRMGPPASTAFMLIGLSLLLLDRPHRRVRLVGHAANLVACLIPVLPLVGYAFGLTALYAIARYTGIALSTAFALLVLALSVLAGRPDLGFARLLCRDDESGTLARQLFVAAVLLTFSVGWVLASVFHVGLIDGAFAISVMTLVLIAGLTALIWRAGAALGRALDQRAAIAGALAETAESLREADRQKSAFLATLSHELRNPLAPIRFALQSLDGPPANAARARQVIGRQVDHLVRLVDDLLDLTRITHNKVQLQRRAVDVQQCLREAADAVAHEVQRGGHDLLITAPVSALWVHADADRLVQILVNLLTNAARYTPAGGRIELGAEPAGDQVIFRVRDTGAGLAPADLDRVFDMFVQVGDGRHGGLGIGLALVKGLVELHGGTVEAESAGTGKGAEFRIRLPRSADMPGRAVSDRTSPVNGARSILVVDDNVDAADTLRQLLVLRGHHVRVAYNAVDALQSAQAHAPEVGLVDLGMPGMDGLTLATQLRTDPRTAGMQLIAITGWGQDEDRRRALAAGFDAHVTKPADLGVLLTLMETRGRDDRLG